MCLLLPGYQGNMNVKFLRRIKAVTQPAMSYFETKACSQVVPAGRTWQFNFLMEVKSFITYPSLGHSLKEPGFHAISRRRIFGRQPHRRDRGFGRRRPDLG